MKRITITIGLIATLFSPSKAQLSTTEFANPPMSARPSTYWEWMNGNISKKGITLDLEYMKNAGYGAAMIFEAGVGIPHGNVDYNSAAWKDIMRHTMSEAERIGIKLSMHNSPGYSGVGGPWITPEYSMKQLVWSDTIVVPARNGNINASLPHPFTKCGYYRDAFVLAYPSSENESVSFKSVVSKLSQNDKTIDKNILIDNNLKSQIRLKRNESLTIECDRIFTVQSATIFRGDREKPLDPHDGPRDYAPTYTLEVSLDGVSFTTVGRFNAPTLRALDAPASYSFPKMSGRYFRITPSRTTNIAEIELHGLPCPDNFAAKINAVSSPVGLKQTFKDIDAQDCIDTESVIDITDKVNHDGNLIWKAPKNQRWTIVRIGYTTTGEVVAAAPESGIGLDVDKFSKEGVDRHFELFLNPLFEKELKPWTGSTLEALVIDSWEAGKQNWTESLPQYFRERRGYDIMPYMLATTGRFVTDAKSTERFLWDFRRTHTDMFLENFIDRFKENAAKWGLKYAGEAYGDGNFESLEMAARQDVPMCEFWTHYIYGNVSTTMMAASSAHIWGKDAIACEAYTGTPFNAKFTEHPYGMKGLADYIMTAGVNRLVYHATTHQPYTGNQSGNMMTMGPFGTHLDRTSTWAEQFRAFNDYVARNSYVLQQGRPVADVLILKDEAISSGTPNYNNIIPFGYRWDITDASSLVQRISAKDGKMVTPDGMTYSILMVTPMERTSPETLSKIKYLVDNGAIVVLPDEKPQGYLGLDSSKDNKVKALADELWNNSSTFRGNIADVLASQSIQPDFAFSASHKNAQIHFAHHSAGNEEVYFVANHRRRPERVTVECRVSGKVPTLWNPETGETGITIPYKVETNKTILNLDLTECGASIIVFGDGEIVNSDIEKVVPKDTKPIDSSSFSISFWAKPETFAANGRGYVIYPDNANGVGIAIGQNGVRIYEGKKCAIDSKTPISGWTHVVLTVNDGSPTLYLNGKKTASSETRNQALRPSYDMTMTDERIAGSFEGDNTEPDYFGHTLSESEVLNIFNAGLPQPSDTGKTIAELSDNWDVDFPKESKAQAIHLSRLCSLHENADFNIRHFSGTATYSRNFRIKKAPKDKMMLNLGRVENMAEVSINGSAPILVWKAPFSLDVSKLLRKGDNSIVIKVTNLYHNRIIGDEHLPEKYRYDEYGRIKQFPKWYINNETEQRERVLFLPWKHLKATDPLLESGLIGPVTITEL